MSEEVTLDEFADTSDTEDSQERVTSRFWGEIPEGWRLVNGSEVYDVNPNPKPEEEPNTYIEMDALDTELPWPKYFGMRDASDYSGKTFTKGDTLFARITPCTENGKAAIVPEMETEVGIGSTEYAVLSPKRDSINPWFLYYLGKSHSVHNYAVSRMRGSTGRQRVPFSVFRRELDVALPPFPEQRKIATILYTVDRLIKKTEEVIESVIRIKKGFKQDVFAEGYFDYQSYQDSQVGKIPASWNIESAADLCDGITVGVVTGATDSYVVPSEGVPFIRSQDVHENYIEQESLKYISKEFHEQQNSSELRQGDVITVRTGEPGTSCVIPPELDGANCFSLIISRPKEEVNERFYSYYINSEKALDFIDSWKAGGVQDNFNVGVMERLPVPVPTAEEQQAIVDSLDDINKRVESERQYRTHLQRLKRGLMQDLLSGTIRTTNTNIEVPDEVVQYG